MRILVVGAGGVGSAVAGIAARRAFFDLLTAYGSPWAMREETPAG